MKSTMHIIETINILIVDDRAENFMSLEMALDEGQNRIFTTTSPRSAVQICIDEDISIALIDVKMPDMDGLELLDSIKNNPLTSHIMVILITGYSMNSDDVIKGLEKGAVDYLFKPLDLYITMAKVHSLITMVNYQKEINRKNKELENYQQELFKAIEVTNHDKTIKENFLANMSHEIRTPLNAIIGLLHLLNESPVNEKQKEMIKLMEFSSQSLLGIVNDILESAKIDAGKIEIVNSKNNIVTLIQTVCGLTHPMAREKGLNLTYQIDPGVPHMIMTDSLRMNQILMNLINNAIKFTNSGSVQISLNLLDTIDESVHLEFVVKDSGVGIAKSSIDKIFNRFEQVEDKTWQKFGGTGLGLSIVKRLVELMGGDLVVKSNLGVGTTFTFTSWFALSDQADKSKSLSYQLSNLPKFDDILVLLAEDNKYNQYITVEMLKKWNIKVDVAANGIEAIEKVTKNDYNLILMDTHMPLMNGNDATRKIREEMTDDKKHVPIISFSASVIQKEKEEAKDAGGDDFIEKPFEPKTLHTKIRRLLNYKRAVNA